MVRPESTFSVADQYRMEIAIGQSRHHISSSGLISVSSDQRVATHTQIVLVALCIQLAIGVSRGLPIIDEQLLATMSSCSL